MKNSKHYIDMINQKLLTKRDANDVSISLNIPEHKFKKHAEKMNWAIWETYEFYKDNGTQLFHLILSMQDYFDVAWLTANILDDRTKKQIEVEMSTEYDVKKKKTTKSTKKKQPIK